MTDKKTEVPGFYKRSEGIIVNKDIDALQSYKKQKEKANKIYQVEQEMVDLRKDITEIKKLLEGLVK